MAGAPSAAIFKFAVVEPATARSPPTVPPAMRQSQADDQLATDRVQIVSTMFHGKRHIVQENLGGGAIWSSTPGATGKYHFDGKMLVATVDGASNHDVAKEQIRDIRFESPTRMCVTPKNTVLGQSGLKVVWERVG